MGNKNQIIDIIIFGCCLFGILALQEFSADISPTMRWGATAPLAFIGLFFGFRASNGYKDKTEE